MHSHSTAGKTVSVARRRFFVAQGLALPRIRMATKITYATLGGDSLEELHRELDAAIAAAPQTFGREHLLYINGKHVKADAQFDDRSPIDTGIALGTFQKGNREHVKSAVAAARAAYPAWAALSWQDRLAYVRRIADAIRTHRYELSALMGYEVGKNRLECVGDVEEAADLMSYYCDQIEHHNGFVETMGTLGPGEDNQSVLRPYGVWAVISPFNFPLALAAGPAGGALAAGNTVVFKPASDTPLLGAKLTEMVVEAGLPPGVFNFVTGPGSTVGQELIDNDGIDGIVFTGSKEVGLKLLRDNAARPVPRPLIIEMGGKNPAIITSSADLEKASDGVMRSAFGAQGQKCSACSRVYIQKDVRDTVRAAPGREDQAHQDRQSARARCMDGTGHQRGRGQDVSLCDRAREEGWREDSRRREDG